MTGSSSLKVGDRVRLHLDSLAAGGDAVGRHEGLAVFARLGCPGDEAEVGITEVSARFARGVVRSVLTPSPDRVEAPCQHFGECGGCQLQHVSYEAQLRHKTTLVREALARIGGVSDIEVRDAWGAPEPWHYRSRARYHAEVTEAGELVLGFARHHGHEIVPLKECRIQHPLSEQVREHVVRAMARIAQGGQERAALLEVETLISLASGTGLVTLVCEGRPAFVRSLADELVAEAPGVAGVLASRKRGRGSRHRAPSELIAGEGHLVEELAGRAYRVSPDSFFQANPRQAGRMIELVREWAQVTEREVLLDVYTGVGTFLLPAALTARRAIGVEADTAALSDARANVRRWGLGNVDLYERRAERLLPHLVQRGWRADVVVMNPPRKGCGKIVCASAAKLGPRRIILVSCDPATMARDVSTLAEHGYRARRVQPVDMFPQTWHVEAVAVCERPRAASP